MFPRLAQFTDLSLLLLRLMVAAVFMTSGLSHVKDPKERADALKFLVHLIGDLHQPFHVTTNTDPDDAGANLVKVISIKRRQTNLHAMWDDDLINYALNQSHLSPTDYAAQLANKFRRSSANQAQVSGSSISTQGSVTDWALEAHRLAWGAYVPSDSYFMIRDNKVWKLDPEYYKRNLPVVEGQLLRAGARLAQARHRAGSHQIAGASGVDQPGGDPALPVSANQRGAHPRPCPRRADRHSAGRPVLVTPRLR